jgi:uncharacterized protein (TIGR00255 family)
MQSMTGFARGEGRSDAQAWVWEARSVNARGLDIRCRLPGGFEILDPALRQKLARRLKRGNILVTLTFAAAAAAGQVRINHDVLQQVLDLLPQVQARLPQWLPPSIEGILGLRGVIEALDTTTGGDARAALEEALLASFDPVVDALAAQRQAEGRQLREILQQHLQRIGALATRAGEMAAQQPAAIHARLAESVARLLVDQPQLPAERLAQEVALLAVRADTREELDRIKAHAATAARLLDAAGPGGRQLDFLCQEFNREANTLCSKSSDIALTQIGLDLKLVIDQMREQVQNIE